MARKFYEILGGDDDFDKEGGYYPCANLADECADQLKEILTGGKDRH